MDPLSKLFVLFVAALLGVSLGAGLVNADAPQGSLVTVSTPLGEVQGLQDSQARFFLGVPFGQDTSGANRFQPPKPVGKYNGLLNATTYGDACPQHCVLPPMTCPDSFSENCLNMDIYTPLPSTGGDSSLKPVLIFFPGGRFEQGGAGTLLYDSRYMASHSDVVVCIINYRLGAFGFLWTDTFPANNGILDQRLAMQWVHDNIAAFGGDKDKVTIFGQSAGGTSTTSHLVAESSWPLFHRAIVESNPMALILVPRNTAHALGKRFAEEVGCAPTDVSCFENKSIEDVLAAQTKAENHLNILDPLAIFMPWSPCVDGVEIKEEPVPAINAGRFNRVPIMQGTVLDDAWMFIKLAFPAPVPQPAMRAIVSAVFRGTHEINQILDMYPVPPQDRNDTRVQISEMGTDYVFFCPTRNTTAAFSNYVDTYLYHFNHPMSFDGWGPDYEFCFIPGVVCHASELPWVFNTPKLGGFTPTAGEDLLGEAVSGFWGNFAHSGNPNVGPTSHSLQWPAYNMSTRLNIEMNATLTELDFKVGSNLRGSYCDFYDAKIGYNVP